MNMQILPKIQIECLLLLPQAFELGLNFYRCPRPRRLAGRGF